MELPGDVLYGDVLLKLSGNREALIENYRGILLYTPEEVAIACKKMTVRLYGTDLHICYFSGNDMKVIGNIKQIMYILNGELCC